MPISTQIPGYNLSAPTESDALAALQRVWDPERGARIWSQGCRDAGVVEGRVDAPALERVVAALADQGGATATVARSLQIRLRTHARLAARANVANEGAAR